jgi:hypothetical protein
MTNGIDTINSSHISQHSIGRSIALHLLPGALMLVFYLITAPLVENLGFPSLMALLLAIAFVLIPFELGYLYYRGKKRNDTYSLQGIVLYREPIPWWGYPALAIPLFLWVGLIMMLVSPPVDNFLIENAFSWLPD